MSEFILCIIAENAFNSVNRKAIIHNIAVLSPEGTTQGDTTSMSAHMP